jgi:GT2 family glycosyltransferase
VVDNGSTDGSAEWIQEQDDIFWVVADGNVGYGRANNYGLQVAKGRHLLVLNPDTDPQPESLRALVDFQEKCTRAGIVSPRLLNPDGTIQRAAFGFPTLLMHLLDLFPPPKWMPGRIRRRILGSRLNGRYPQEVNETQPFKIDHPLGACFMLSRDAYEDVGGFDPRIFMYSEEVDLALRYRKRGWECWQVPAARVIHFGGQSTGQAPERMQRELWRSRVYLYRKHYSRAARIGLSSLLLFRQGYDVLAAAIAAFVGKQSRDERLRLNRLARDLALVALGK